MNFWRGFQKNENMKLTSETKRRKTSHCDVACNCKKCSKIYFCSICKKPLIESCLVECETCKVKTTCKKCCNIKHSCIFRIKKSVIVEGDFDYISSNYVKICQELNCKHLMNYIQKRSYLCDWMCNKHTKKCAHCGFFDIINEFPSGYNEKIEKHTKHINHEGEKYARTEKKIVKVIDKVLKIQIKDKKYDKINVCLDCIPQKYKTQSPVFGFNYNLL